MGKIAITQPTALPQTVFQKSLHSTIPLPPVKYLSYAYFAVPTKIPTETPTATNNAAFKIGVNHVTVLSAIVDTANVIC